MVLLRIRVANYFAAKLHKMSRKWKQTQHEASPCRLPSADQCLARLIKLGQNSLTPSRTSSLGRQPVQLCKSPHSEGRKLHFLCKKPTHIVVIAITMEKRARFSLQTRLRSWAIFKSNCPQSIFYQYGPNKHTLSPTLKLSSILPALLI